MGFEFFIQDGIYLMINAEEKVAFFQGVNLIQILTLSICFLIGPWQFIPYLFRRFPTLHYALGNVYVMMTLLLSAPTTIASAFGLASIWENIYVVVLGLFWWWSTRKGIYYISNKKMMLHIKWMMRSYLTLINIVLLKVLFYFQFNFMTSIFLAFLSILILLIIEKSGFQIKLLKAFLK